MSNSRSTVSTSRLDPCTKPFSPMHRFALVEQNFASAGSQPTVDVSSIKALHMQGYPTNQNSYLQLPRSPVLKENQDQLSSLQTENEKLQHQVREANFELERVKRRCEVLQVEKNQYEEQLGYYRNVTHQTDNIYFTEFQAARAQSEEWKQRCQELEVRMRQNSAEFQQQLREFQFTIQDLNKQIEKRDQLVGSSPTQNVRKQNLTRKNSQQKEQMMFLEGPINQIHLQDMDIRLNKLRQSSEISFCPKFETIHFKSQEVQSIQMSEIDQRSQKIEDQQIKIQLMSSEIERLQQGLRQKSDELQKFKYQNDQLINEIERLNKLLAQRTSQLEELRIRTDQNQELERLNNQMIQIKEDKRKENQEIDRLKMLTRQQEQQLKEMEYKFHNLNSENNSLRALLKVNVEENGTLKELLERGVSNEVETWKKKFCSLNRDYHQIQETLTMTQVELEAVKSKQLSSMIRKFQ